MFLDKSYNVIKSTKIVIKCISIEIYTPIQSKSPIYVAKFKRFCQKFMFKDTLKSTLKSKHNAKQKCSLLLQFNNVIFLRFYVQVLRCCEGFNVMSLLNCLCSMYFDTCFFPLQHFIISLLILVIFHCCPQTLGTSLVYSSKHT